MNFQELIKGVVEEYNKDLNPKFTPADVEHIIKIVEKVVELMRKL